MNEWPELPLEECLAALIDYRGKSPTKSPTGIPVISAKVVKDGRIIHPVEQTIDPSYYDEWMRRGLPCVGDVVLTTEGPLGEIAQLDLQTVHYALGQRIVVLRGRENVLDNTFLKFLLQSDIAQRRLHSFATGTTVSGISQKSLRRVPLPIPPISEQRGIAELLGSLDDKIELNRRLNDTLEAMAQAIFRDWFVDFGPTRRKIDGATDPVEIMDGLVADPERSLELAGLFSANFGDDGLPGGWSHGPLGDLVANVVDRCVPSETTRRRPYIPIDMITAKSLIIQDGRPGSEAQSSLVAFRRNDILFGAMRPYFHKVALSHFDGTTRTTVFVLRPKDEADLGFALMTINDERTIEYATQHSSGTTIPYAVWRGSLERMSVLRPPSVLRAAYGQIIQPMLDRMLASASQNRALAETRDLLLPKLMSGDIRVHAVASASE